jgi:molecular chaperone Hsp33
MTNDILHRFIFENEPVRGEYVKLDESVQTILAQHDYPPVIKKLLGESLCVAALLSAVIKFTGRLTVQFRGKGKLKLLLAQCDEQSQLRGLAKYDESITQEELAAAFTDGVLVIMLDSGVKGQRYQGVVEWKGDSLAESIEHYFQHSEQLATRIWLTSNEQSAFGYLLQVAPLASQDAIGIQNEIIMPSWQRIIKMTEDA